MIIIFVLCVGLVLGVAIDVTWISIDTLAGTKTFTEEKGLAVVGLSVIGTGVVALIGFIYSEW